SAAPLVAQLLQGVNESKANPELAEFVRLAANALLARSAGNQAASIKPWRKALAQALKVFGDNHYVTVWARFLLAGVLYGGGGGKTGALGGVVRLSRQCLQALDSWALPKRHVRADAHLNIGRALLRLGVKDPHRNEEAEAELRRAVTLYQGAPASSPGEMGLP